MTEHPDIRLAVLDMAGTTVADDGLVETAFGAALLAAGVAPGSSREPELWTHVRDTMGQSKIEVFRAVFDEDTAQLANRAFEQSYNDQIDDGRAVPLPGAAEAIGELRAAGILVTLTTGFSRATQQRLITGLGWDGIADLVLCPEDAGGRGRPYPDMVLTALLRLRVDDVAQIAVVGDTASDIRTGRKYAGQSLDREPSDRHERNTSGTPLPFGQSRQTLRCPGHDFEPRGIDRAESNVVGLE